MAVDFENYVERMNDGGWRVLNLFQIDQGNRWRARLQHFARNGATTNTFAEADAETAIEAVVAAFRNGKSLRGSEAHGL